MNLVNVVLLDSTYPQILENRVKFFKVNLVDNNQKLTLVEEFKAHRKFV